MLSCPRRPPEALASGRPSREGGGASPSLSPSLGGAAAASLLCQAAVAPATAAGRSRGARFSPVARSVLLPIMDLIGALDVGDLAAAFAHLPVFPVFDLGYFVVSLLYLKYEKGKPGGEADPPSPFPTAGQAPLFPTARKSVFGWCEILHLFLPTDLLRRAFFIELLLALMIKCCLLLPIPSIVLVMLALALVPCLHPHIPPCPKSSRRRSSSTG